MQFLQRPDLQLPEQSVIPSQTGSQGERADTGVSLTPVFSPQHKPQTQHVVGAHVSSE